MTTYRDYLVDALDAYRSVPVSGEGVWKRYWDSLDLAAIGGVSAFEVARKFSQSPEADRHHVAVDFLGRIADKNPELREECVDVILASMETNADVMLLASAATALGSTGSLRSVPFLLGCLETDVSPLRINAVIALASCVGESKPGRAALLNATADGDPEVKLFATMGLAAVSTLDGPDVRDALAARLFDKDDEVRNEAIRGLAKRHDDRARGAVEAALTAADPAPQILKAAEYLGLSSHSK